MDNSNDNLAAACSSSWTTQIPPDKLKTYLATREERRNKTTTKHKKTQRETKLPSMN